MGRLRLRPRPIRRFWPLLPCQAHHRTRLPLWVAQLRSLRRALTRPPSRSPEQPAGRWPGQPLPLPHPRPASQVSYRPTRPAAASPAAPPQPAAPAAGTSMFRPAPWASPTPGSSCTPRTRTEAGPVRTSTAVQPGSVGRRRGPATAPCLPRQRPSHGSFGRWTRTRTRSARMCSQRTDRHAPADRPAVMEASVDSFRGRYCLAAPPAMVTFSLAAYARSMSQATTFSFALTGGQSSYSDRFASAVGGLSRLSRPSAGRSPSRRTCRLGD